MPSNPTDEQAGLADALVAATAGVITRTPNVLQWSYDGNYTGPWPLILLPNFRWRLDIISGGQTLTLGQGDGRENYYTVEIHDVVDPRDTSPNRVAKAQADITALIGAIAVYFNSVDHRCLKDGNGVARARRGGVPQDWIGPTQVPRDGGEVRLVAVGRLGVLGLQYDGVP